ncbi:hypothetical protein Trydic_g14824 [Trypoxylus dichotomus]
MVASFATRVKARNMKLQSTQQPSYATKIPTLCNSPQIRWLKFALTSDKLILKPDEGMNLTNKEAFYDTSTVSLSATVMTLSKLQEDAETMEKGRHCDRRSYTPLSAAHGDTENKTEILLRFN